MEKVLDAGFNRTVLANIGNKIQSQVFMDEGLFRKNKDNKNGQISANNIHDDYSAFLEKAVKEKKNDYPSIFSQIRIKEKKTIPHPSVYENISYPLLGTKTSDLVQITCGMIRKEESNHAYSEAVLRKLITEISQGYNIVAYHTFTHAVSLMHLLFNCFQSDSGLKNIFTPQQRNFALIASLAHDINHPGNNNGYQTQIKSKWSELAENQGVLQKMHLRYFHEILKSQREFDIDLNSKKPLMIKEMITRLILSTDLSRHFVNLNKLKDLVKRNKLNLDSYDHRYFMLQNIFHACDIGNPCLPFQEYINWSSLVSYQFNLQTELEAKNNMEITKFFIYKGKQNFYKDQIGFINGLVYPLWKQLSINWPGLSTFVNNISVNLVKLKLAVESESSQKQEEIFIKM